MIYLVSFLFQVAAVIILPIIFGIDGIWFSVVAAELVAAVMTVLFIAAKRGLWKNGVVNGVLDEWQEGVLDVGGFRF